MASPDRLPDRAQVDAALARVNDPEIKRPITDLGMVERVDIDDTGKVTAKVLLTVAGCPMKDTINRDVSAEVSKDSGVTGGQVELAVMSSDQRAELQDNL